MRIRLLSSNRVSILLLLLSNPNTLLLSSNRVSILLLLLSNPSILPNSNNNNLNTLLLSSILPPLLLNNPNTLPSNNRSTLNKAPTLPTPQAPSLPRTIPTLDCPLFV